VKGAGAYGFVGELWTLDRITTVIERLTDVKAFETCNGDWRW
jgi:hypothetical protein